MIFLEKYEWLMNLSVNYGKNDKLIGQLVGEWWINRSIVSYDALLGQLMDE